MSPHVTGATMDIAKQGLSCARNRLDAELAAAVAKSRQDRCGGRVPPGLLPYHRVQMLCSGKAGGRAGPGNEAAIASRGRLDLQRGRKLALSSDLITPLSCCTDINCFRHLAHSTIQSRAKAFFLYLERPSGTRCLRQGKATLHVTASLSGNGRAPRAPNSFPRGEIMTEPRCRRPNRPPAYPRCSA